MSSTTDPSRSPGAPLLTLEPLLDVIRETAARVGWQTSGLQKTTSTEFEGRWKGESTRSAYLFLHHDEWPDCSVDVFLDETSRGLRANLALVADLHPLPDLPPLPEALEALGTLSERHLPTGLRTPVTVRLRLADAAEPGTDAEIEARLKAHLSSATIAAGAVEVRSTVEGILHAYEAVLSDPTAGGLLDLDPESPWG